MTFYLPFAAAGIVFFLIYYQIVEVTIARQCSLFNENIDVTPLAFFYVSFNLGASLFYAVMYPRFGLQ